MIIAGVVIETLPGRADSVASRLAGVGGLRVQGSDGYDRVAGVWTVTDSGVLQRLGEELVRSDKEILGVHPTLVSEDKD